MWKKVKEVAKRENQPSNEVNNLNTMSTLTNTSHRLDPFYRRYRVKNNQKQH